MKSARIHLTALGCCSLLWATGAPAADWTPSTAPAMPGDASAVAAPVQRPIQPPPDMALPPQLPSGVQAPMARFGPSAGGTPPEYDPETGRTAFDFAGLRLIQSSTDDAYLLDIELRGLPAEQVQVHPAGSGLMLVVQHVAETSRAETFGDGYGFRRSWGYSSGRNVKRLPTPPDADVLAMQREDGDDAVHISIPRRADLSGFGAEVIPTQPAPGGVPQGQQP